MPALKRKRIEKRNGSVAGGSEVDLADEEVMSEPAQSSTAQVSTVSGAELAASLYSGSFDVIRNVLIDLRIRTNIAHHKERPAPADKRIRLAEQFCQAGGLGIRTSSQQGKGGIFQAWDTFEMQNHFSILPLPIFALSNLIALLGAHQPTHSYVEEIVGVLLPSTGPDASSSENIVTKRSASKYWTQLQSYLMNATSKMDPRSKGKGAQDRSHCEMIALATLHLMLELTNYAGGKYASTIFDNTLGVPAKSLTRLMSMRRRLNKKTSKDRTKQKGLVSLDRPDIRTLWILFLLSFLRSNEGGPRSNRIQISALSLGREYLPAIIKGLADDPVEVVVYVLTALHDGLLSDDAGSRIPRAKVAGFFSEWACKELLALYEREGDAVRISGTDDQHSLADVAHHFMLALCTHPGRGICYVDQGWYGRTQRKGFEDEGIGDETDESPGDGVYNKILLGLLKSLLPTRSPKQAELALRILQATQELLCPYLTATTGVLSSTSLEPRGFSIAWLSSAAFIGRVLQMPLPPREKWKPHPPPVQKCIDALLPVAITKASHTRGILHLDRLTRHVSLTLLSRLLDRLQRFDNFCQDMSVAHDAIISQSWDGATVSHAPINEDSVFKGEYGTSQEKTKTWASLRSKVLEEARERVPDLTTILDSLDIESPLIVKATSTSGTLETRDEDQASRKVRKSGVLVVEAALRAGRAHFKAFKEASSSDAGRLLSSAWLRHDGGSDVRFATATTDEDAADRLPLLCQIHATQLATSFVEHSAGGIDIFTKHTSGGSTPFRHLLHLATSSSLDQVQQASRDLLRAGMLGTVLFEHSVREWEIWQYALDGCDDVMKDFFDECVQRCLKTPYRYIKMAREDGGSGQTGHLEVSPIFSTMVEQIAIHVQQGSLSTDTILHFIGFLARFLPALITVWKKGDELGDQLLSCNPPSATLLQKVREKLAAAEDKYGDKTAEIEGGGARFMQKDKLNRFLDAIQLCLSALTGSGKVASRTNKQAIQSSRAAKDLLSASCSPPIYFRLIPDAPIVDPLSVDWTILSASRVETGMMLIHCSMALLHGVGTDNVGQLLESTLQHGNSDANEVHRILLLTLTQTGVSLSLSQVIAWLRILCEAPLDWAEVEIPTPKCFVGEVAYDQTDKSKESTEQIQHLRKMMVCMAPSMLQQSERRSSILDDEDDYTLFIDVASGATAVSRRRCKRWRWFIENLVKQETSLARSGLHLLCLVLKEGITFSAADQDLKAWEASFVSSFLLRQDHALLDIAMSDVLDHSRDLQVAFWSHVVSRSDQPDLLRAMPLCMAKIVESAEQDSFTKQPAQALRIARCCINFIFDADQRTALLLSQAGATILSLIPLDSTDLTAFVSQKIPEQPREASRTSALLFARDLVSAAPDTWLPSKFLEGLLDKTLLWLVRRFAEDSEEGSDTISRLEALSSLLEKCLQLRKQDPPRGMLKAHLVEPVLAAAVANRQHSTIHLRLILLLVKSTHLKHTVLSKVIADLLSSRDVGSGVDQQRNGVVEIVYAAVDVDDALCDDRLAQSLMTCYDGSLSLVDRKLLEIFHLCERRTGNSISALLRRWKGATYSGLSGHPALDILLSLDSNRVYDTSVKFPRGRGYEALRGSGYAKEVDSPDSQKAIYDPLLILGLVGSLSVDDEPLAGLQWLQFVQTNALGVVTVCLSSRWPSIRRAAAGTLAKLSSMVPKRDDVQFQQKEELNLVLDYVRNSYQIDAEMSEPPPLPLTTTVFVAHALRCIGLPSLYLYPLISRFLLQRPQADISDVPLLYNFFYSSSAQSTTYKAERMFMLRFLLACIKYGGKVEWDIMRRRHVWDSLCSLYTTQKAGANVKRTIEDIFLITSLKADLAYRVVVRHGFLHFLRQLYQTRSSVEEKGHFKRMAVKCLANLLSSVDLQRLERTLGPSYLQPFAVFLIDIHVDEDEDIRQLDYCLDLMTIVERLCKDSSGATRTALILADRFSQLFGQDWEAAGCALDAKMLQDFKVRSASLRILALDLDLSNSRVSAYGT